MPGTPLGAGRPEQTVSFDIRESNRHSPRARRNARVLGPVGVATLVLSVGALLFLAITDPVWLTRYRFAALFELLVAGAVGTVVAYLYLRAPRLEILTLDPRGIHVTAKDGSTRSVLWDDPDFAVAFFAGTLHGTDLWIMAGKAWGIPVGVPREAYDAILHLAELRGLTKQSEPLPLGRGVHIWFKAAPRGPAQLGEPTTNPEAQS
jgi:hypothetical protein